MRSRKLAPISPHQQISYAGDVQQCLTDLHSPYKIRLALFYKRDRVEVVLRKYGNSTVLAFPPALLKELGLKAGQTMTLDATSDGRITLVAKRRHKLADLIAQCDLKAQPPADLKLWNHASPVGREVW